MMIFPGKIPFYLLAEKFVGIRIKIQESKSPISEIGSKILNVLEHFCNFNKSVCYERAFIFKKSLVSTYYLINNFKIS